MLNDLQMLARSATTRIDENASLEQIEKAANIVKAAADAEDAVTSRQNTSAQIRLDWFKTVPSLAIPVISLLTLLGTIWIQARQLETAQQQNEDTQWREFLKDVRSQSENIISDPTVVPRLKSFLHSRVYGTQVTELTKALIGSMANKIAFDEMFGLVYKDRSSIELNDIIDINRQLQKSQEAIDTACQSLSFGITFPGNVRQHGLICDYIAIPDVDVGKYIAGFDDAKRKAVTQKRREKLALVAEIQSISELVAKKLKEPRPGGKESKIVDLSGLSIFYVDLSGVDFSKIDLTGSLLDTVDLTGANLAILKGPPNSMGGSNWWEAKSIDPNFLKVLVRYYYPGFTTNHQIIGTSELTEATYRQKVTNLCRQSGLSCEPETMNFVAPNFSMFPPPPRI